MQFVLQFLLVRKIKSVFSCIDVRILRKGQFDESILFLFAEEDTNCRLLPFLLDVPIIVVYLHLHLTEILVCKLVNLYVDEDIALQQTVVEDQVYIVVLFVKGEALLSCLE